MKMLLSLLFVLLFCSPVLSADYVIGDGDVLVISVWGIPALSGPATVRPDGKITMAAGGDVTASGLTTRELSAELTRLLLDFVKKPIVTVKVEQVTNNKVYVAGDGIASKVVQLPGRTTLFRFLCGLENLENCDLRRAYLVRDREKVPVDFHALLRLGDLSLDIPLQAEDIIFLPSRELSKVYVLGAVNEPRFVMFRDGMRVLDSILEAGGFNEYAKYSSLTVHRLSGEKLRVNAEELLKGKDISQNIYLQPGDYVTVAEGLF
jgi:polysaccharide export outer membrane protein